MWWFDSLGGVARVLTVGFCAYAFLVALLRVSGKRTLSKLNAFDLVVTVAMGSTLATVLLSKDVPFAEGAAALLVLVVGQYLVARLSIHSPAFAGLVRSEPRLLVAQGRFLEGAMAQERVTRAEVLSAIRGQGVADIADAFAVVMETDGSMHVIRSAPSTPPGTLQGVKRPAADDGSSR